MEQVYFATAVTFAIIGRQAFINWRAERKHMKSLFGQADADGRVWLITSGISGLIGGEYIEEV